MAKYYKIKVVIEREELNGTMFLAVAVVGTAAGGSNMS